MIDLNRFKNSLAKSIYGITKDEAINKGICINCNKPPKFYSLAGEREYNITAMCEYCFDALFDEGNK